MGERSVSISKPRNSCEMAVLHGLLFFAWFGSQRFLDCGRRDSTPHPISPQNNNNDNGYNNNNINIKSKQMFAKWRCPMGSCFVWCGSQRFVDCGRRDSTPTLFPLSSSLIYVSTKPTPCRPLNYGRAKRAIAPWQADKVLVL